MKTCGIYAVVVDNYRYMYIGQSKNIEKRTSDHLSLLRQGKHYNTKMQNVFNKYGESSFEFILIEKCERNKLNEREQCYIFVYGTFYLENPSFGLNLTMGGEGRKQAHQDEKEKTKRKISRKKFIDSNPDYYKNIIGMKLKEKYKSKELRERNSNNMKKLHKNQEYHNHYLEVRRSEKWRKQMSEKHKGNKQDEQTKKRISEKLSRKVICENGMIFDSAKKAAQYVKEKYGKIVNVQAVCSGKRKTAAGLRFQWLKEAV